MTHWRWIVVNCKIYIYLFAVLVSALLLLKLLEIWWSFSWYSYTSTLKLHGVSGDEPEEDDVPAADEDAHGDQEQSGAEPGDQEDEKLHDEEGAADLIQTQKRNAT